MKVRRQLKANVQPDLIPMIDIVFQLVVFFMVSSTFVVAPGIGLDLPESSTEEQVSMDLYQISVNSDGSLYFQDRLTTTQQLPVLLGELSDEEKNRVVIQGDAQVPLQTLVTLLDTLRANGVRNASILAKNPSPSTSANPGSQGSSANPAAEMDEQTEEQP